MKTEERQRIAEISRKTRETTILVKLSIDGSGECKCIIPDEFLRHMVETLTKYSGVDMDMTAEGDMEHHLVEDVAITIGKAYRKAIGEGAVKRIASSTVPMDEALVQVSVDLIDRPYVHLEMPDIMYEHFIRSFAMELRATIHSVVIRGKDEHHIIEATFKALGIALRTAMTPVSSALSTKSSVVWGE
ncbi:MAG: imidazoleglycerol-phosphate dehydratase [Methanomassiliicoccus sp.]|nr:MAG: imidazoleglycerol-phosphate dehydratase [Methanomassiliicoccus sp.]